MNSIKRFFFLLFFLPQIALGAEPIGTVLAIKGTATAIDVNQNERPIKKHSLIYLADTIIVAIRSKLQIKFTDGSLLNLIPNTTYRIDDYQYRIIAQSDSYSASLFRGGFRMLTGSIAKKNPDQYQIHTPVATIGVRGTILIGKIVGPASYFGCESGQAIVFNSLGEQIIGIGAESQYSVVWSPDVSPEVLLTRPPELDRAFFIPPMGALSIDQTQKAQQKGALPPTQAPTGGGTSSTAAPTSSSSSTSSSTTSTSGGTSSSTSTGTTGTSTTGTSTTSSASSTTSTASSTGATGTTSQTPVIGPSTTLSNTTVTSPSTSSTPSSTSTSSTQTVIGDTTNTETWQPPSSVGGTGVSAIQSGGC